MRYFSFLALAALALVPARAATLFTTLGPGATYSSAKYGIDGGFIAFAFEVDAPGSLDSISVVVLSEQPPASMSLALYAGTPTSLGTLLESLPLNVNSSLATLMTVYSTAHPHLDEGTTYWLALADNQAANGSRTFWYFGHREIFVPLISQYGQGVGGWIPAFALEGTATPEPAVTGLVLCGLLAMGAARRRWWT